MDDTPVQNEPMWSRVTGTRGETPAAMDDQTPEAAGTKKAPAPRQITIALPEPIVWKDKSYSALVIHEPRAFDMMKAEEFLKDGANFHALRLRQIHLIAHCARVPVEVVMRVGGRHINEAWDYLQPFC